jgi:regulator of RNase E activity RraA/molybdopterin-guanine dinucleotide biosynthesis protein A
MRVVAFVPAKGHSSRIDNKNARLLDGKPLFIHTLEKLSECTFLDAVYLDTESDAFVDLASEIPCRVMRRDPALASNATDGNALLRNEIVNVDAEVYVQVLCTSPFISKDTIQRAVDVVSSANEFDSAVLVRRDRFYRWDPATKRPLYDHVNIPNSVDLEDTIVETMGLYVIGRDAAKRTGRRIGDRPFLLEASPTEAIDVNVPEDFDLAQLIAAGRREAERRNLQTIKFRLTSAMLSDILDSFGAKGVVPGLSPNIPGSKVLGRAKTLKLRALSEGEDVAGIYRALDSYATMVPNDVIVVENQVPDLAYFGELNAHLAIRAGAIGAVIGGMTRDSGPVSDLHFPVFSTGSVCKDVKGRATVESINKRVMLHGVSVTPGDLVFCDSDGVVVIPKLIESAVLERAFRVISEEVGILADISAGVGTGALVARHGTF